ncbi:dapC [Scenedesmus sp. PABB004]|nr:dapC [Scenedesmus sp. PABB004]
MTLEGGSGAGGAAAAAPPPKPLNHGFSGYATTVFEVMSKLAAEHGSVNLGQGFPDDEGPAGMKEIACKALYEHSNQYPSLLGVPALRQAVARHCAAHGGVPCDWASETLVTVGATEGIASAFMGLTNPGDEVVVFEPLYDSYAGMAQQAGVKLVPVQLQPPDWSVPRDALAAAFSAKTKFLLLNTPHNPTGKVFTLDELQFIAGLVEAHNTYALLDEVYEHLVLPPHAHVSLAALPGMVRRCVRLGSAGKTFSFTAWKVGWMTGPAALLAPVIKAHQFVVFTVAANLQHAVAYGLDEESGFYLGLGPALAAKRSALAPRLEALGLRVLPAQGTYFLVADASSLLRPGEDDVALCKRLTAEAGVTLIPISAFYASDARPHHLVRFCFCKSDEKLDAACERLGAITAPARRRGARGGPGAAGAAAAGVGAMVRFKNRYFILCVRAKDGRVHESIGPVLPGAIRAAVQLHQGDAGLEAASPGLAVPFYHHLSGVAIVRVARSEHVKVLQSCLKMNQVDFKGVTVQLLKLTGAFRVAKRAAGEHAERLLAPLKLRGEQAAAAAALKERLDALHI